MIRLESVTKRFGEKVLLNEVSYPFPTNKKIALIGPNGAGKSTLFGIMTGLDHADYGDVHIPKHTKIGYLPQEPNPSPLSTVTEEMLAGHEELHLLQVELDKLLKALDENPEDEALVRRMAFIQEQFQIKGGYSIEAKAEKILAGLGFDEEKQKAEPTSLSGGWRMRLELAKLFLFEPTLLLLDEPTNHLDLPSLIWVENYLEAYPGTVVLISHDRDLLNRFAEYTVLLEDGTLKEYAGNFDRFTELYALEQEQRAAELASLGAKKSQLMRFVERFGSKASKAKQAQSKMKQIQKLEKKENTIATPKNDQGGSMALKLSLSRQPGKVVLQTKSLNFGYEVPLFKDLNLSVQKKQRVAILGANGIGKTTFLKTIVGRIPKLDGEYEWGYQTDIAYFAQDQVESLDEEKTIMENILQETEVGDSEARSILGALLFSGDDVKKKLKVLSGGEKNRVGLACILATKANILILDEPTNHLDMTSVEVLLEALEAYPGTILFVSHNRSFVDRLATHVLALRHGFPARLVHGNSKDVESFLAPEIAAELKEAKQKPVSNKPKDAPKSGLPESEIKKLKKTLNRANRIIENHDEKSSKLSARIEDLEKKQAKASSSGDFEKLTELQQEHQILISKIDDLETEWMEAEEAADRIKKVLEKEGRL